MTPELLKQYLDLLDKYSLKRIKFDDLEVEFSAKMEPSISIPSSLGKSERMPTEDELLFASSGIPYDVEAKPPTE